MNKKSLLTISLLGLFYTVCATDSTLPSSNSVNIQESSSTQDTKPQKNIEKNTKKKKKKNRCPYSNMPLKKLTAEQLEEVYEYTKTHTMDNAFMIDLLERLIALSDNHAGVKRYKLQLADTHYNVHHLERAAACYEDFGVMYPGSQENEYVLYKAFVCMFELCLDADRDQTNTRKTILLAKEFLKKAHNKELITQAQEILQQCYQRLYDHEVYVFNFYTKRKNFVAAQMRIDYILKNFATMIDKLDDKVAALSQQLENAKHPAKLSPGYLKKKLLA